MPVPRIKTRYGTELLRSILFIVLITLLSFTILVSYILISANDNFLESNRKFISFFADSIDKQLLEIQKYSRTLELHPTCLKLKEYTQPITAIDSDMYALFDQMNSTKLIYNSIDRVMTFFPQADISISDAGAFSISSFIGLEEHNAQMQFPLDPMELLTTDTDYLLLDYNGEKRLANINIIRAGGKPKGVIVIVLNLDAFLSIVKFPSNDYQFSILFDEIAVRGPGTTLKEGKKTSYITLEERSKISPHLTYTYTASFSSFYNPLITILRISICAIVLIFINSIILTLKLSWKKSKQIGSLINTFGTDPQDEKAIEIISNKITDLLKEKELSLEEIQIRQGTIGGLFLNLMIADTNLTEATALRAATQYGITFGAPYFAVAVIKSANSPDNLRPRILSALSSCYYDVFVTFRDGIYAILFNMEDKDTEEEIKKALYTLKCEVFSQFVFSSAIGSYSEKLTDIRKSFSDAITILKQNPIKSTSQILSCTKIDEEGKLELTEFRALLSQKKYEVAGEKLTPAILTDAREAVKKEMTRLQELGQLDQNITIGEEQFLSNDEAILQLKAILMLLSDAKPNRKTLSTAGKAKDIIESEFTDPMLGLYAIADKLCVSNSYLSATFKDSFGIGINHYINQMRIDMAKNLITTTDLSIRDIAFSTGFLSDISFIRVFKKFEATTPTQLRTKGK